MINTEINNKCLRHDSVLYIIISKQSFHGFTAKLY